MKKQLRLTGIVLLLALSTACNRQSGHNFTVVGKFTLPVNSEITISKLGISSATTIDSSFVSNANEFKLKGYLEQPALFSLRFMSKETIYLIIKPDENLIIDIDNTMLPTSYYVKGSTDSRLVHEIMVQQERVMDKITGLSIEYEKSKLNPESFEENKLAFDSIYDNLLSNHKQNTIQFITDNPKSLACIFALYQNFGRKNQPLFSSFDDIDIFNFVDSNLTQLYPETDAVIALNRDVTEIKEQKRLKNYSDKMIEPGRKAPAFEVTTIQGNTILLSDYKDEPVVFVFFAVWNSQSAQEAITLNEIYKNYRYNGLKIVGVSFDNSEGKLTTFIENNKINYPVVCDYKYWDSDYVMQFDVRTVPDILLIDKNHIVHKRNINTSELISIITEWRKSNLL